MIPEPFSIEEYIVKIRSLYYDAYSRAMRLLRRDVDLVVESPKVSALAAEYWRAVNAYNRRGGDRR